MKTWSSVCLVLFAFTGLSLGWSVPVVYGHGGDPNMIHSCVNNSSGTVKFVGPNDACHHHNETAMDWDKAFRTVPGTFNVDCDAGQKINDSLGNLIPGDTLLVSGVCNENVLIQEEVERVTVDGQGTATINGASSALDTIDIRGRGITIKSFGITGGSNAIGVRRGGTATIDGNVIQYATIHGITVFNGSVATIVNNMIQNNSVHGIQLIGASATIGFRTSFDAAASPNVIQNNGNIGINLSDSSSARIGGNTISGHPNAGINVGESSSARIGLTPSPGTLTAGNTIQNNGNNGIRVFGSSYAGIEGNAIVSNVNPGVSVDTGSSAEIGVRGFINTIQGNTGGGVVVGRSSSARIQLAVIGNNTGHGVQIRRASQADIGNNTIDGNTADGIRVEENSALNVFPFANTGTNSQFGIRCLTGGYATGPVGGLTGTSGPKSFGITVALTENPAVSVNSEGCIDKTTP